MSRWPDIIPVAINHLLRELNLPRGRAATKVPTNVDTLDAFVRVSRGPGSDDRITDSFLVDVETFTRATHAADAWTLAEDARQAMHDLAATSFSGALVDTVTTATSPTEIDYGNPKVVRYVASYRVTLRKVF